jgi:hypothetical protein
MGVRLFVVWGDLRTADAWDAVAADLDEQAADLTLSPDGSWAEVKLGPTVVAGPVATDTTDQAEGVVTREVVVIVDDHAPEWLSTDTVAEWGWRRAYSLPVLKRRPFLCDVMLLTLNWADQFDGWSTLLWLDSTLVPMARVSLALSGKAPTGVGPLEVRVLEVGSAQDGVPFAVLFCPDSAAFDRQDPLARGWRTEPRSRAQRRTWRLLMALSDSVAVKSVPLLGHDIISEVTVKRDAVLTSEVMDLLPADVRDAIHDEASQTD